MSNRLDEELERAVAVSEQEDDCPSSERPVAKPASSRGGAPSKRSIGLLAGLLVIAGGVLVLVFSDMEEAAIYSKGVDELVAEQDRMAGRTVRVQGTLVKGSLVRRDEPCEYRFRMEKNGQQIPVRYPQCVVPDTFRDVPDMDVEVTAEGKLAEGGHFQASHIMAKCPSKYEMKQRAGAGEAAPHGDISPAGAAAPVGD